MRRRAAHWGQLTTYMDLGSAGRGPKTKKPSVPKAWRDLRKSSKKALKRFSSFLRGASCPKSPRFKPLQHVELAAATASLIRQNEFDVKQNVRRVAGSGSALAESRQTFVSWRQQNVVFLRPIRISMRHLDFRSIIPGEATRHRLKPLVTRPFVQYRFCLRLLHPQLGVNAGVILYGRRAFFRDQQE